MSKAQHPLEIPDPPIETLPRERPYNTGQFQQGSYSSGKGWSVKMDRSAHVLRQNLYMAGTLTTGGTPASATARIRNPLRLFGSRLSVFVNGKEEMGARPDLLLLRAQWRRGQYPVQRTALTTAGVQSTSQTLSFAAQLPLDFVPPAWVPGHYGVLIADKSGDVIITGTWGTLSDLVLSAGTQAIASGNLALQLDRTRMSLTPTQMLRGFGHVKLWQMETAVPNTQTQHFEIPGGKTIAAIYMLTEAGSTPEPSDSVFTSTGNIKIARGPDIYYNGPTADLLQYTQNGLPQTGYDRTGQWVVDFLKPLANEQPIFSKAIIVPGSVPLAVDIDVTTSTGANVVMMTEDIVDPITSGGERYNVGQ